jgi:oxygen-independent coproporphyrinogen III oxidase
LVAHLYIHIPFCKSKCGYCDFFSVPIHKLITDDYINALVSEISLRYSQDKVATIYFGGGTPSLLTEQQTEKILSKINYDKETEITMECNPNSINKEKLKNLKNIGINRISIGIQTFNQKLLNTIGRKNTNNKQIETIQHCLQIFENTSIDLMHSLPEQSLLELEKDIKMIPREVKHISYYELTLEKNTLLFKKLHSRCDKAEDLDILFYEYVTKLLQQNNFNRYEISNYCKHGYECKHNQAYWNYDDYLGIGAGAVSTIQGERIENIKNIENYIMQENALVKYQLTEKEIYNERLLMQLRTTKGSVLDKHLEKYLEKYPDYLQAKDNRVFLTKKGMQLYNTIVVEMML